MQVVRLMKAIWKETLLAFECDGLDFYFHFVEHFLWLVISQWGFPNVSKKSGFLQNWLWFAFFHHVFAFYYLMEASRTNNAKVFREYATDGFFHFEKFTGVAAKNELCHKVIELSNKNNDNNAVSCFLNMFSSYEFQSPLRCPQIFQFWLWKWMVFFMLIIF